MRRSTTTEITNRPWWAVPEHPDVGQVIAVGHRRGRWMFVRKVFRDDDGDLLLKGRLWQPGKRRWARSGSTFHRTRHDGEAPPPSLPKPKSPTSDELTDWRYRQSELQRWHTITEQQHKPSESRLLQWLKERCEPDRNRFTLSADLHADYLRWLGSPRAPSLTRFVRLLDIIQLQLIRARDNIGRRGFRGIALRRRPPPWQ